MAIDWSQFTLKHIQQACELYDSGVAVPRRPARSTFLLMNSKSYPAKFIRGLAYRLATGVELDPSRDYSGGLETVRFFHALGLTTQHDRSPGPAEPTAEPTPSLSAPNGEPLRLRREHREPFVGTVSAPPSSIWSTDDGSHLAEVHAPPLQERLRVVTRRSQLFEIGQRATAAVTIAAAIRGA